MKPKLFERIDPVILAIALLNIAVRLLIYDTLEYHRDELLYFSLGHHPAFGYASVPPLIGWISWLMQNVFGSNLFAVRLFPALLGGVMIFIVASMARELGGTRYSSILAATGLSVFIIAALLFMKGKGYYTLGIYPMMIAAGGAAFDTWLRRRITRIVLPFFMVLITIPVVPIGLPVLDKEGLKAYFKVLDEKYGIDLGRRFEDGSIHSLPQDYADMIGWEELTAITDSAYNMIGDKQATFIYGENYGQAGAITVIGKKYGLPEAVSFSESFRYWFPREFPVEMKSFVYINDEPGEDVKGLFARITLIGRISDPDAREYGTGVFLCEEPVTSFNTFWKERTRDIR